MVTVGEVMSADPVTLAPDERLDVARAMMLSCRIRHLPVGSAGKLVGMVSSRDLVGVALLRETAARQVMHRPVETTTRAAAITSAAEQMIHHHFSSLPVVEDKALVGIVTTTDLVRIVCETLDDQLVSSLMTPSPLATAERTEPLALARVMMKVQHIRHLPVVEGRKLVGFLTDLDVLAVEPGSELTVADAMSAELVTVSAEGRASEAGRLLVRRRLDAVPVVRGSKLVGLLSVFDFLHYLIS